MRLRRLLSLAALVLCTGILASRIHEINTAPEVSLAPRTLHLLYMDSLRTALLTFSEQYGRPVFQYDTTSPVTGHGRIQLARLREALFDPRIEYVFTDYGFSIEWRSDPKPRMRSRGFVSFGDLQRYRGPINPIASSWPGPAQEYARIRRIVITPQWPDPPRRRVRAPHPQPLSPPQGGGPMTSLPRSTIAAE